MRPLQVFVKRPPVAVAGDDLVVAPGETVNFDGSGSLAGERPIARYFWDFYDGGRAEGQSASHAFAAPGRYIVTLRVEDDSIPPCNFSTAQQIVQVNAQPVAVAGEDQRLATGQTLSLDGQRSYDVDGGIAAYEWDLGDGTTKSGATVQHAYDAPGTYVATLTVQDDAGVANSRASSAVRIQVNAPPVAEAGPDRHVAIGEVITFDAAASTDPDGKLIAHLWDFGDGARGDGQLVQYAYPPLRGVPGRAHGARRFRDRHQRRERRLDRRGQRAAARGRRPGSAGELERGALRWHRLARPGRRARPLRMGFRRRHQRSRADAGARLQVSGQLSGPAHRDRRLRHFAQQRRRRHAGRRQRRADRRRRARPGRCAGPGADLRRPGLDRPRRRRRRISVVVQGRRRGERPPGPLHLRPTRRVQRAPQRARRHRPGQGDRLRRGQGRDQRATGRPVGPGPPGGAGRCGDLRRRQLVRSRRRDRDLALGLQRPGRADLQPRGGSLLRGAGGLYRAADGDRRQRRDQRGRPRRGRDPHQPRAGRLGGSGHRHL